MHTRHALALRGPRPLESEMEESPARCFGDHLDALDDARHNLVLDRGVEVFSQFADNEQIDALESGRQAAQVPKRPYRGEQAELAAKLHVEIARRRAGG